MRRAVTTVVLTLTAAVAPTSASAAPAVPAPAAAPSGWRMDGYGPGNTGWNPGETAVTAATITRTYPRWKIPAATPAARCAPPPIAPVIADGRLFELNPRTNGLSAYSARTGAKLWDAAPDYNPRVTALAVADDVVIAASADCDVNIGGGQILGYDAGTGKQLWRRLSIWRTPGITMDRGVVLVGGGGGGVSDIGYGINVYRAKDGADVWSTLFQVPTGVVAAGGRVLLRARADDPFPGVPVPTWTAVDITTGKRLWHTGIATSGVRAADPAGTTFYLADGAGLRAVSASTGRQLWRVSAARVGGVSTDGVRVYVSLADQVRAYDARTGRRLWSRAVTAPGKPIRAADLLYVQTGATVAILTPATGATAALSGPFRPVTGHIVVADGRLYVTDGSSLRAYTP
ncbi:PQQ-binding-like beta-propeller repeat protein [Actinoplanes sp. N902-109]|uniref:outer membrane protein assembly factor BamB family protein n=1 Tax=Actinoplanes sp. (strain N902-109) TaxID=649831 RepID=UPI0018DD09AD|nr:PQQ-binding-like beta-propeller repeat protein [Actinoplanes sp. N902-109]